MHHFLEFLLLTFSREEGYWDSFFRLWYNICIIYNKLLHRFFSNNKALLSSIRTSYIIVLKKSIGILKKEAIFVTFRLWLYEEQLGLLRGISQSPRCRWYAKSLLFLFCVYMIMVDDTLRSRLSKRSEIKKYISI